MILARSLTSVIHGFSVSCIDGPVLCRLVCTFRLLTPLSNEWDCCGRPLGVFCEKTVLRNNAARSSVTGGGSLWSQILYLDDHYKLISEPAKALKAQEFEIVPKGVKNAGLFWSDEFVNERGSVNGQKVAGY